MVDTVYAEREVAKRSGDSLPDAAFSLDAFGKKYNLKYGLEGDIKTKISLK